MRSKIYFIAFLSLFSISLFAPNASATHISEPVLLQIKSEYFIGDFVTLEGWVNYENKATPDVLLDFKIKGPDGSIIKHQSYTSDSQGQFRFEFDTSDLKPGIYQASVTSQCLEIHRSVCTYKSQTKSIKLIDPAHIKM